MRKRLISIGGIAGALIAISGAWAIGRQWTEAHRPWAIRDTEIVVAGFQADRVGTDVRDIEGRIERLKTRKSISPRQWGLEDQKELDYWLDQIRQKKKLLQEIESKQRPVVVK